MYVRVPNTTARFSDSPGGHIVLLLADLLHTVKGHKAKSSKGRCAYREALGKPDPACKSPLWVESLRTHFVHSALSCDDTCEMPSTRKFIRDSVPRVFTGGWSCKYPRPNVYQNSRLPEGRQVFSIHHIVCTVSVQ